MASGDLSWGDFQRSESVPPMTVQETAEEMGLKVFDTALPQPWFDSILKRFGLNPSGHFVWSYDDAGVYGKPVALTSWGTKVLMELKAEMVYSEDEKISRLPVNPNL